MRNKSILSFAHKYFDECNKIPETMQWVTGGNKMSIICPISDIELSSAEISKSGFLCAGALE
jgi:hypothetical protein